MAPTPATTAPSPVLLHRLATFRYRLRHFLRFSEQAARDCGVTPLQHQLLLGVAGFTGEGRATISELADFLQHRHNAVVALVTRARTAGLVAKQRDRADHRIVRVQLTARGRRILTRLSRLHEGELARFQHDITSASAPASAAGRQPAAHGVAPV